MEPVSHRSSTHAIPWLMSSFEPRTRFVLAISSSAALMLALVSCTGGELGDDQPGSGGTTGNSSLPGKGGASSGSGASSSGGNGASSGTATSQGGSATGGSTLGTGGSNSGSGGSAAPPCTDVQHPEHMDKECSIWAEWDALKGPGEARDCDS